MTSPARLAHGATAAELRDRFALDVQYYLTQDPRQLPSRYLYDPLGSALFEAICQLPWYSLTRAELRLLNAHAREILTDQISTIVELGSGAGDKLSAIIAGAGPRDRIDVHIVDVSASALALVRRALDGFEEVAVTTHEATYEAGLREFANRRRGAERALMLFLGSNIGNFDPPGREALLTTMRRALRTGDRLLLGADLIKSEDELRLAYDDPLGITAAFNRNLIVRINRELQGRIDLDGFAHRAVWNRPESRVEMHLVSRGAQRIDIPAAGLDFVMNDGETIWTESSYKFDPAGVASMLARSGFRTTRQWVDPVDRFALTCAEAI